MDPGSNVVQLLSSVFIRLCKFVSIRREAEVKAFLAFSFDQAWLGGAKIERKTKKSRNKGENGAQTDEEVGIGKKVSLSQSGVLQMQKLRTPLVGTQGYQRFSLFIKPGVKL